MPTFRSNIVKIEIIKTIDEYEVLCRLADWQDNFGNQLEAVEEQHFKALGYPDPADAPDDEEDEGDEDDDGLDFLKKSMNTLASQIKETHGEEYAKYAEFIRNSMASLGDDDDDEEDEDPDQNDDLEDEPDVYSIIIQEDMPQWSDAYPDRLQSFLTAWPSLRTKILNAAFAYYQMVHEDAWLLYGGRDEDKIILPDPDQPADIEQLFRIRAFHLYEDKDEIGLSGTCTWDDEHGFGCRIKKGEILGFSYADEVY